MAKSLYKPSRSSSIWLSQTRIRPICTDNSACAWRTPRRQMRLTLFHVCTACAAGKLAREVVTDAAALHCEEQGRSRERLAQRLPEGKRDAHHRAQNELKRQDRGEREKCVEWTVERLVQYGRARAGNEAGRISKLEEAHHSVHKPGAVEEMELAHVVASVSIVDTEAAAQIGPRGEPVSLA
eukprot:5397858-Pleurochrysis_carterae.AAC.1